MKDKRFNLYIVITTGILAILIIISVQLVWLRSSYNQQSLQFDQQVRIALNKVAQNLSKVTDVQLPNYDLITKKANNYYLVNINETIDASLLEFYLKSEFEKVQLQVPYEYGIYDCDSDRMLYGAYIDPTDGTSSNTPTIQLKTSPDLIYYFGILFPTRQQSLISNSWIPLALCLLLVLSILFFVYGLTTLLRERKLTLLQKSFIDNMAHELKTPLSTIKIASDVITEEANENSRLSTYATIIKNQNENLLSQVNRLLDISTADMATFRLHNEVKPIYPLVEEIVHELVLENPDAKITVIDDSQKKPLAFDPFHLKKILRNIIENSIKYSVRAPQIKISIFPESIHFSDNGIGISSHDLGNLGQQFYRGKHGIEKDIEGFGLGLYYVKRICSLQGWRFTIESQINQGTSIKIYFA